jgi:hypothetical protein
MWATLCKKLRCGCLRPVDELMHISPPQENPALRPVSIQLPRRPPKPPQTPQSFASDQLERFPSMETSLENAVRSLASPVPALQAPDRPVSVQSSDSSHYSSFYG